MPPDNHSLAPVPARQTIVLVAALGTIYMVSQFLRNSVGVIAPELAAELQLSASQIGLLSSGFFFAFAASQLPLGVALDRFGPLRLMLIFVVLALAGTLLFSFAPNATVLVLARVLMGIGSSCFLMAPLMIYARRYPPESFATFAGIQLGVGSVGTLLATAPLASLAAFAGWRGAFLYVGAGIVAAAAFVALVVRERETARSAVPETLRQGIAGLLEAMRTKGVGRLFFMQLTGYSSFVLVVGLWGGPYLTHIYGYGIGDRGRLLLFCAFGQIVGVFLFGPLDRVFGNYRVPVLIGALFTAASLMLLGALGTLPPLWIGVWFGALGLFSAYTPLLIAHGRSLFPPRITARGLTLFNVATVGGVFVSQTISGFVIDLFPVVNGAYALDAYRLVFVLQALTVLASSAVYLTAPDPLAVARRIARPGA